MKAHARGFTLIEALIALVVLSVGLLGATAMLLESMRAHAAALRRMAVVGLVHDMAERIRMNPFGRAQYDTRGTFVAGGACDAASACDVAQLAAADRAQFTNAAHALFPSAAVLAEIAFEPATGPATPDRYVISLRFSAADAAGVLDNVELVVLAHAPVAGGA